MPTPFSNMAESLLERLAKYSTTTARNHAGVRFDPKRGLGETPDAGNIDYMGFQAYMTPKEFIGLNPARNYGYDYVSRAINDGTPISTPLLYVNKTGDGWRVGGHEGRGRMMSLDKMHPDSLFPVGIKPMGEIRARHLSPESLWKEIVPEDGGISSVIPRAAILNQTPYVRPGMENDEAVIRALLEMLGQ